MMNLIIFIFFALLDAGIVGLCGLCYSGREKYHEGMILGIRNQRKMMRSRLWQKTTASGSAVFRD